ncbi:hypothetical protein RclHR1_02810030 [Rhizophagus clarus]|uniref:Uncharacterized protein n=1 Tax=Rhizophagus clarus TaxID=94130 RepID=A0A2Z6R770_9GLOM|nr:hypothetical protein RclHR1_02810030 [Rhizophagus clarus]GES74144.1 hypothetical protein GLOIN_2v1585571 [Rhizophagus clarus]
MYPTRVVRALHKHVPLIKFLGPRNKFHKERTDTTPKHPAVPKETALPSNTSSDHKSKIVFSQLPEKYKRKGPSPEEIDAIEHGGADNIIRYKGYFKF